MASTMLSYTRLSAALVLSAGVLVLSTWLAGRQARKRAHSRGARPSTNFEEEREDFLSAVGNTPLILLPCLSQLTGCRIYGKCEFMNPGGSVKDRVALAIIEEGERSGKLKPGMTIVEASAGSTGIALAMVARAKHYPVVLFVPSNISVEKVQLLEALGATLHVVPIVPLSDPNNFMHRAHNLCIREPGKYFYANQFDNPANFRVHFSKTGREIWEQTKGRVDAVVMGAGTGGTLAGVSQYLKMQNDGVLAYLVDPPGSGLYNLVEKGLMYVSEDHEIIQPLEARTVFEGVGINRQTDNFKKCRLDGALKATDKEGVDMAHFLLRHEGLFLGGSSAMHCVGAVKLARMLGAGHTIVTMLCDAGHRYQTKLFNNDWLAPRGLLPSCADTPSLDFVS